MTIRMLINAMAPNELRIAIVEDGELIELDIEASETSTLKGNVYKGVIHNVEASLEAAFVDYGRHKQGFLPFSEVSETQYGRPWHGSGRPRITDVLKRGQEIVVQVAKDAIGEKGATLTTYLSLPGRYTVLMPDSDSGGISRKIEDERVRRRMRLLSQRIKKPDNCGFIVRTAGFGQTRLALQRDLDKVVEQWRKLRRSADHVRGPSLMHSEPDLIGRTLRDYFSDEIDEVLIDSDQEFRNAKEYFRDVMPAYEERLIHYKNPIPIFSYYRVEEQIEETFERQVAMPSGGSIVIDETEALVAIDVNSGKMTSEGDHEKTVFKTNCEAAEVIARQLKLRDLGGIVVIDFIDMEETKHKREVEHVLAEAAKADKARYKISRINSKGLCVLTRQRIRQGMRRAFQHRCTTCAGTGWIRSSESHSLSLIRRVRARLAQGDVGEVRILTHPETSEFLLNRRRSDLFDLEQKYACIVTIQARSELERAKDEVVFLSNHEVLDEVTQKLAPKEDRRTKGGTRRKRRKPSSGTIEAPATVKPAIELEQSSEERNRRRRKRRKYRVGTIEDRRVRENGAPPSGLFKNSIPAVIPVQNDVRAAPSPGATFQDDGSEGAFSLDHSEVSGDGYDGLTVVQAIAVAEAVQAAVPGPVDPNAIFRAIEVSDGSLTEERVLEEPVSEELAFEAQGLEEPVFEAQGPEENALEADEGLSDSQARRRRRRRRGRRKRFGVSSSSELDAAVMPSTTHVGSADPHPVTELSEDLTPKASVDRVPETKLSAGSRESDDDVRPQVDQQTSFQEVDPAISEARRALLARIFGVR